jgi:1-acyl-sn-glycerol-3-phosphate acyltransferase
MAIAPFYNLIRWFAGRLLLMFYREVVHSGDVDLPSDRPLLLAANHPNSIMDPIVLTTSMKRPVAFLARSGLFSFAPVGWLLRSFHAIPVMRRQDGGDMTGNKNAFAAAHSQLAGGGVVGIFPHGTNVEERRIDDIRSGAARIALGAEAENGWNLNSAIVPVGMNYEDRDRFNSRLLVRWGVPISVAEYRERYEENEQNAVAALTEDLLEAMRQAAVNLDIVVERKALDSVRKIYAHHLHKSLIDDDKTLQDHFFIEGRIGDAIAWMMHADSVAAEALLLRIDRHLDLMQRIHLKERVFRGGKGSPEQRRRMLRSTWRMIAGLPFAAWGILHNWLPYRATVWFTRFAGEEAIVAVAAFLSGITFFSLWYALLSLYLYLLTGSVLATLVYALSIPGSGLFAVAYLRWLRLVRCEVLTGLILRRHPSLLEKLRRQRSELIAELDTLRELFVADEGSEIMDYLAQRSSPR